MKRKIYAVVFRMTFVLMMAAFLSTVILATADTSFAAQGQKKSQGIRTSAVEYTEAQIKQLQGTLNITEGQAPLWNNLTQVMRENAKEMDAMRKERAENTEPMNAVEHMKFHSQITQSHLSQMNKLIPPFEAFYESLTDQQKNITNIVFRTGKYGKSKRK
jgi:lipopolysaccharide export LptBFGC system permease protein LptF